MADAPHAGPSAERYEARPRQRTDKPRRYDVEVIGFDNGSVGGLTDRQGGVGSEKIHHHALMRRIEVLDKHERHVAMCGQCRKEPFASLKPPGRGTDANDKEIL